MRRHLKRELKRVFFACLCVGAGFLGFTSYPHEADAQQSAERSQAQSQAPAPVRQGRFIVETDPDAAFPNKPVATAPTKRTRSVPREFGEFRVDQPIYLETPLEFGYYFWDERYFRASGRSGPVQVVVDLDAEQLYVYRANIEIARTKITRGWDEHETPTGTFPILEKDKDHYSSTYDNAPMPYNLRLTWPGVAIHGADVDNISATHGCIGVPLEFAEMLFANTKLGDKVLITRNWQPHIYGAS